MADTPVSLLERLRVGADPASWRRLVDLYTPIIHGWLRQHALQASDADDLSQEILRVVVAELPQFRHNLRQGAFRTWLKGILLNRLREFWRERRPIPVGVGAELAELEDSHSQLQRSWDENHDREVVRRLLELAEPEFEPATWQAFRRLVIDEQPTLQVAADLGLSVNAVRIAKSRVLARLRVEVEGLVD